MVIESVEFRLVNFIVLFDFGIETIERFEVKALVRIVERLAEIEILQLITLTRTGCQTGNQRKTDH